MPWADVKDLIANLGFPIFAVIVLGMYVNRISMLAGRYLILPVAKRWLTFIDTLINKVNSNADYLKKVSDDIQEIRDDINVMRDDISYLREEHEKS